MTVIDHDVLCKIDDESVEDSSEEPKVCWADKLVLIADADEVEPVELSESLGVDSLDENSMAWASLC